MRKEFPECSVTLHMNQEDDHGVYRLLSSGGKVTAVLIVVLEHLKIIVEALASEKIQNIGDARRTMMASSKHSMLIGENDPCSGQSARVSQLAMCFRTGCRLMPRAHRCGCLKQKVEYVQLEELVNSVAHELSPPVQNGSMVID